jgi:DNA-binding transcriptional LysR family regulator
VAHGRSGRLRIGLTDDAATLALTSVLAAFHARSPNVLVELVELSEPQVLLALRANTVDLILASEPQGTRAKGRGRLRTSCRTPDSIRGKADG